MPPPRVPPHRACIERRQLGRFVDSRQPARVRFSAVLLLAAGCASSAEVVPLSERMEPSHEPPAPALAPAPPPPTPAFLPSGELDPMTLTGAFSTSMQNPVDGWLVGGVPLPLTGRGFRFNPAKDPRRRYGTVELVQGLMRAAAFVDEVLPGGELTINDIAMPAGAALEGHASHRNGRDVDVLFYLLGEDGQPYASKAIPIEPDGSGADYRDLRIAGDDMPVKLDVPRTWAFVAALLSDEEAHINRIFVVEHVRALLLAHAEQVAAPAAVVERFGHVTCQPKFPHDDHFHIRFYCAADDIAEGCEDTFPIYPWHEAHLAAAGAKVQLAKRRPVPKPELTSVAEAAARARARYGPFHPEVTAFLKRRKAWVEKPSPGRPYCE